MSIGSRIKEARESKQITRIALANQIGVTPSAIANYENGVSSPKLDLMYKLFEALDCDANYLFQDEMAELQDVVLNASERIMIHNYRELDEHGKKMVDFTLREEWKRSIQSNHNYAMPIDTVREEADYLLANAAHEDTNALSEAKTHDDNIMNDDNEWK
jgi:transcriptional regulator with XRE-family HTH domain